MTSSDLPDTRHLIQSFTRKEVDLTLRRLGWAPDVNATAEGQRQRLLISADLPEVDAVVRDVAAYGDEEPGDECDG